jgi:hypothetical protein
MEGRRRLAGLVLAAALLAVPAVDVLTPTGVSQADELDYTIHDPVVIAPIALP